MAKNNKPRIRTLPAYQRNAGYLGNSSIVAKPKRATYLADVSKPVIPPSPEVQYTAVAYASMQYLVNTCKTELGWVGAVEQINPLLYIIHDVRVMEQNGAPATFKYDNWNDAVTEMITNGTLIPGRIDANLGHSHVRMGVTPSGVDEEQMMDLLELDDAKEPKLRPDGTLVTKFSIQTIHNKQGAEHAAVYDWEHKRFYPKCTITVQSLLNAEQIADLDMQLERVKPYTYTNYNYGNKAGNYGSPTGFYSYNAPKTTVAPQLELLGNGIDGGIDDPLDLVTANEVSQADYVMTMENWTEAQWVLWNLGYEEEDITDGLAAETEAAIATGDPTMGAVQ